MMAPEKSIRQLNSLSRQLMKLCKKKDPDLNAVRSLIEQGASVNYRSSWTASTPLASAVGNNNLAVVQLLVDSGVDLTTSCRMRDDGGHCSPIAAALSRNNQEMARLFMDHGLAPTDEDLYRLCGTKNKDGVAFLLRMDIDLSSVVIGSTKNYAIYRAEEGGDKDIIRMVTEEVARRAELKRLAPPAPQQPVDPRDARIASLEAQIRALAQSLTAVQAELDDIKHPQPDALDKKKLPAPRPS